MQMNLIHRAEESKELNMLLTNIELVSPTYDMYGCPQCSYKFPSMDDFKKHMQISHPKTQDTICKICHKQYKTVKSLRRHEKTHLNAPPVKVCEPNMPCPQCPKKFTTKTALHWHVERNHTDKEKTSTCHICGKELADHALLKRHLEMMHSLETATCSICNKTFKSVINLQRHSAVTHPPELAEQTCQICRKTFKCSTHLRIHIRTVHALQTVFNCDLCGKGFSLKKYMLKHRKTHVDVKEFQCEICYQVYKTVANARRHAKRVHMKPDSAVTNKTHKCHVCDKEFTRTKYLFFHKKTHDDKTLPCNLCNKLFKCTSHVNKHTKRVHTNTILKKNTDTTFYCDTCKKPFSKKKNLAKHIQTHIFMKKESPCGICNKLFKTNSDVNRHLRKVHMKNMNIKEMIMRNKIIRNMKTTMQAKTKTEETLPSEDINDTFTNIDTDNELNATNYAAQALEVKEYTNKVPTNEDYSLATLDDTDYKYSEHILTGIANSEHIEASKGLEYIEDAKVGIEYAMDEIEVTFSKEVNKNEDFNEVALENTECANNDVKRTDLSNKAEADKENIELTELDIKNTMEGPTGEEQDIQSTDFVQVLENKEQEIETTVDNVITDKSHRNTDIIMAAIENSHFTMEDLGMTEIAEDLSTEAEETGNTDSIVAIESARKEIPELKYNQKLGKADIIKAAIEISDFSMEDLGIVEKEVGLPVLEDEEEILTSAGIKAVLENVDTTEDIASTDLMEALESVDCSEKALGNSDIIKDAIENSNFTMEDLGLSEFTGAAEYTIDDFGITECPDIIDKTINNTVYAKEDEENIELTNNTNDFIEALVSTEYTKEVCKDVLDTEFVDQALESTFFIDVLGKSNYDKVPHDTKFTGKLDGPDFIEAALKTTDFIDEALISTKDSEKDLIEEARENIEYAKETNDTFLAKSVTDTDIKQVIETPDFIEDLNIENVNLSEYTMNKIDTDPEPTVDLKSIEINLLKCLKCGIDFENDVDLHTHLCGGEIMLFLDFQEM